jgi:hypothetical protein
LPCVLFLHGEYVAQDIFECKYQLVPSVPSSCPLGQFSDPRLREHLNLIAVDMRKFGCTDGLVTKGYTPAVAADDVYKFMVSYKGR